MQRISSLLNRRRKGPVVLASVAVAALLSAVVLIPVTHATSGPRGIDHIQHFVVIDLENWSFDSLYGHFPGANGVTGAGTVIQVDKTGVPYTLLPQPLDSNNEAKVAPGAPPAVNPPDTRFPAGLPNRPFDLEQYVPPTAAIGDITGGFYQEQSAIDGGRMDRYVAVGGSGALPLGSYDATRLPLGGLAKRFTLADEFFHAAFGSSMLNHLWLISAATPRWPGAPASMRAVLGPDGALKKSGAVTPDGYLVNTAFPAKGPHPKVLAPGTTLVPALRTATIGDRLSAKHVSWAWYSGGWSDAIAGHPAKLFQFNHQPFAYFAKYANGSPGQAAHLKDEADLVKAIRSNTLPAVSFYKPLGSDNEHPGYANLLDGERHTADLINAIMAGKEWKSTAIIVTYDENGGFWDHVAPPFRDKWGPGTRVPTIVISPFAKRGFVDHTTYDTTSILALIEHRFGLLPLSSRDASAADLTNAFNFKR